MKISVKLTPAELLLLDGKVSDEVQKEINTVKISNTIDPDLSESERLMIAELITIAKSKKRLTYSRANISSCPCCKTSKGYHLYTRSSRSHRKGDKNYSNPIVFTGFDLDRGVVTMQNYISRGFCGFCEDRVKPELVKQLLMIVDQEKIQLPEALTGVSQKYFVVDKVRCIECSWEGLEDEMKKLPAMMGGEYFGGCPKCEAKNLPFGRTKIERNGFTTVDYDPRSVLRKHGY